MFCVIFIESRNNISKPWAWKKHLWAPTLLTRALCALSDALKACSKHIFKNSFNWWDQFIIYWEWITFEIVFVVTLSQDSVAWILLALKCLMIVTFLAPNCFSINRFPSIQKMFLTKFPSTDFCWISTDGWNFWSRVKILTLVFKW